MGVKQVCIRRFTLIKRLYGAVLAICMICMIGYAGVLFNNNTTKSIVFRNDGRKDMNNGILQYEQNTNTDWKDNSWSCSGKLFLVYRCVGRCGGWGDRQKGIISSFLLALFTNRTLIFDIQKPCDVLNHLETNIYNWTRCKKYVNGLPDSDIGFIRLVGHISRINALNITRNNETWSKRAVVLEVSSYAKVMEVIRQHHDTARQLSWIKNFPDYEVAGLVLRSLFKPKPKLRNHLKKFIEESTQGRQLVCGHLRMGRNPSIPDENLQRKPMNETAMFTFLDQFTDVNKYVIYLASDSDLVREKAAKFLQGYINLNRKIVHVDRFGDLNRDIACDGFYTALFEQYLFTKCDYLIFGRSNFAVMAAYMRGHSKGLYLDNGKDGFIPVSLADIQTIYGFQ